MLRLNRLMGGAQVVGIDPTQVEHLGFPLASGTDRLGRWQALVGARVAESFFDPRTGRSGVERRPVGVVVGGPPRTERAEAEPPNLQGQRLQLVLDREGDDGRPVERIVRLRVTGVLRESGGQNDYTLYLALSDVLELNTWFTGQRLNPGRDGYNQALVKVASPEQVMAVQQEILERGLYAYSAGSTLQAIPLILYSDVTAENGGTLNSYHHSDEWSGGAWLTADDKSSVVFVGTKGMGDCWYGCADGTVWPEEPPYPPECPERGWWSSAFVGQMLFYDPKDLAAVAQGEMEPHQPQPYAVLDMDPFPFPMYILVHRLVIIYLNLLL